MKGAGEIDIEKIILMTRTKYFFKCENTVRQERMSAGYAHVGEEREMGHHCHVASTLAKSLIKTV